MTFNVVLAVLGACSFVGVDSELGAYHSTRSVARETPLTEWSCRGSSCSWDCSGPGLQITRPGRYDLRLTEACSLDVDAWGGGGGGGIAHDEARAGGGGGGGGTLVLEGSQRWLVAGGGGGGASVRRASPSASGGGGGGGAHVDGILSFQADAKLTLLVGGGGAPGCNDTPGNGGPPFGSPGVRCSAVVADAVYGGGGGGQEGPARCIKAGSSQYGGGGGSASPLGGGSVWGGAGGASVAHDCVSESQYGGAGTCGTSEAGGGGGGGGGMAPQVHVGVAGVQGSNGDGGSAHEGGAGGRMGAPDGGWPGGGGVGSAGSCGAGRGGAGALELRVTTQRGAVCPADHVPDCAGRCAPAVTLGDGICDDALDCPVHGSDGGDCTEPRSSVPDFLTEACPEQTAEPQWCLVATLDTFAVLGLDSHSVCPVQRATLGTDYSLSTLAFPPPYRSAYYCLDDMVIEQNLQTGEARRAFEDCRGITDFRGTLMALEVFDFVEFASFDAIVDRDLRSLDELPSVNATALAADDTYIYASWFSGEDITVVDPILQGPTVELLLEDKGQYVNGLEVIGDVVHFVQDGPHGVATEVVRFDLPTGAWLGTSQVHVEQVRGLACVW